jgi:glycosyltransferase involved in cell wall biosynthesis
VVGPSFRPEHRDAVAPLVSRIETFAHPAPQRWGRVDRAARLLDPTAPATAARALAAAVDREVAAGRVDVVVLSGKDTVLVADAVDGRVPLVVDLCDAASSRVSQELRFAGGVRRAGLRFRRHNLRRVERHLVEVGDVLLTASARDRVALVEEGTGRRALGARVVPNGVDLAYWDRGGAPLGDSVVFCGNLGYRPNADAARHLVHEVMPRVWARHPDAELVVVGTGASPALAADLRHSLVTLTGAVPDVRPHLRSAAVFAAPLRIATGIQNKLLEAMAMELPVVTSPPAAAGLHVDGPPPIDVAEEPATAAALIASALDDVGQGRRQPRHDARAWVADRFTWESSGRALARAIRTARKEVAPC